MPRGGCGSSEGYKTFLKSLDANADIQWRYRKIIFSDGSVAFMYRSDLKYNMVKPDGRKFKVKRKTKPNINKGTG